VRPYEGGSQFVGLSSKRELRTVRGNQGLWCAANWKGERACSVFEEKCRVGVWSVHGEPRV